jgi:hypothetical protein
MFHFSNLAEFGKWLEGQAESADSNIKTIAPSIAAKNRYLGEANAYSSLARMIAAGDINIGEDSGLPNLAPLEFYVLTHLRIARGKLTVAELTEQRIKQVGGPFQGKNLQPRDIELIIEKLRIVFDGLKRDFAPFEPKPE